MSIYFGADDGRGKVLREWWQDLDENNRGGRAQLKRAASPTEVALTPAYQRLCRRIGANTWSMRDQDRFAAVVGLLAHVKTDDARAPAKAMSQSPGEDKPPVSELRFMRLLDSPDIDTLFAGLRRVLPLMKHSVNVIELANDLMHFDDQDGKVRKKWAYGYDWPDKSAA